MEKFKRNDGMILTKTGLKNAILYGLLSGLVLATFLKGVELITHLTVYTLLLNVDYIPYINTFAFPELIEVGFHLLVSIALAICLYLLFVHLKISSRKQIIVTATTVCLIIGIALFPTTTFSDKTPDFRSFPSFSYWMAGHIIYGYILGYLLAKSKDN
ncbi:hypothetical protein H7992_14095 [Sporosarcina sp. resist]|nr:hypothetical protein [Sporosarcina sp. resist]QNK86391.1 hypothetical protein H7992_14095 [Sporosarcina sp. resist]